MPIRSVSSPVLKWPDKIAVESALREWFRPLPARYPELLRFGYYGSYARGDWGTGSDLDLIAIVSDTNEPFHKRSMDWPTDLLPVPAELIIYTLAEWDDLKSRSPRLAQSLARETVWIWEKKP